MSGTWSALAHAYRALAAARAFADPSRVALIAEDDGSGGLGGDGFAARAVELVVATGLAVAVGDRVAESIALRDVLPVLLAQVAT
jgi:hypothetical protein